jgi:signal transduction histidine kinase/CheY-like chemotaxis protein
VNAVRNQSSDLDNEPARIGQLLAAKMGALLALTAAPTILLTYPAETRLPLAFSVVILGVVGCGIWLSHERSTHLRHLDFKAWLCTIAVLAPLLISTSRLHSSWVATLITVIASLTFVFASHLWFGLAAVIVTASVAIFRVYKFGTIGVSDSVLIFLVSPMIAGYLRFVYDHWRRMLIDRNKSKQQLAIVMQQSAERLGLEESRRRESVIQLHQAQKSESLELFAGSVANSFNNSLMAIIGYSEAIKRTSNESNISKEAARIEEVAIKASRICKQMLDFAKRDSDKKESHNLHKLLSELALLLETSIPPNIELCVTPGSSSVCALANAGQLKQLIANLILNSVDAIPSNKAGQIRVAAAYFEQKVDFGLKADAEAGNHLLAGEYAMISVSDNGHGIDEVDLPLIFDPYFTTRQGKNGFGLSIAAAIATSHDGAIRVDSTPGQGTVVKVILPLGAESSVQNEEVSSLNLRMVGRLLIVDDDPLVLEAVSKMVEAHGWNTVSAENGAQALKLLKEEREDPFSAIILDYSMPDMNGDEVLKRIRKDGCETPVILCTGMPEASYDDVIHQPEAYLRKPYHLRTLQTTIASVVLKKDE